MTNSDYIQTFYGYPILNVGVGDTINANTRQAYRVHCEYNDEFSATDRLGKLLEAVPNDKIEAIILGAWLQSYEESPQNFIDLLIANRNKLVNLKALFNNPCITYLKKLDLEHHFMTDAMMEKMKLLSIEVNVADQQGEGENYGDEDAYCYVSVSE